MDNFNKILNLVKKTGDKIIVMKEDGTSFVLMPFNDYEKIVDWQDNPKDLSEQELWERVDRDIALWREGHDDYYDDMDPPTPEPWEMESESLPWEREEIEDSFKFDEEDDEKDFVAPEFNWEGEEKELEREPIKYEDIPLSPNLNVSDLMDENKDDKEEIIDMSFDDEDVVEEKKEESSDFMEEPVF